MKTMDSTLSFVREMIKEHVDNFDEDNINDYIDYYIKEMMKQSDQEDTTFTGTITCT